MTTLNIFLIGFVLIFVIVYLTAVKIWPSLKLIWHVVYGSCLFVVVVDLMWKYVFGFKGIIFYIKQFGDEWLFAYGILFLACFVQSLKHVYESFKNESNISKH
jgi:hypothetical protein